MRVDLLLLIVGFDAEPDAYDVCLSFAADIRDGGVDCQLGRGGCAVDGEPRVRGGSEGSR